AGRDRATGSRISYDGVHISARRAVPPPTGRAGRERRAGSRPCAPGPSVGDRVGGPNRGDRAARSRPAGLLLRTRTPLKRVEVHMQELDQLDRAEHPDVVGDEVVPSSTRPTELPRGFEFAVEAAAAAEATPEQLAMLDQHRDAWRHCLERLLHQTDEHLESVRTITGPERDQIVADFEQERDRLEAALARLDGASEGLADPLLLESAGQVRLQASWASGRLVVWAGGPGTEPATAEELEQLLRESFGLFQIQTPEWSPHPPVQLPDGARAPALALGVQDALAWLMALGGGHDDDRLGSSVTWLGRVVVWAVRLVAAGHIVPTLRTRRRGKQQANGGEPMTEL